MKTLNFKKHWLNLSQIERQQLAQQLGTTTNNLRNIAYGVTKPSVGMVVNIVLSSSQSLSPEDVRPDFNWDTLRRALNINSTREKLEP